MTDHEVPISFQMLIMSSPFNATDHIIANSFKSSLFIKKKSVVSAISNALIYCFSICKTKHACLNILSCSNTKDAGLNFWQLMFLSLTPFF